MDYRVFSVAEDEEPLTKLDPSCGFAGIFHSVGVIGDSLASGEFESRDARGNILYHDMYEYAWPAILQRLTGCSYENFSRGGMTAKEYVDSWADQNGFWKRKQAYIVALGNNDTFVFHHPLGSPSDIFPEDPRRNADTFFGNMGRILSKLKTLEKNSRIFLVTPLLRGEKCDEEIRIIAKGLSQICGMFSDTYFIDLVTYGPVYDEAMRKRFGLGFHPNAMGYHAYALMIGNYIDYIIRRSPEEFSQVPFIGTNLKY